MKWTARGANIESLAEDYELEVDPTTELEASRRKNREQTAYDVCPLVIIITTSSSSSLGVGGGRTLCSVLFLYPFFPSSLPKIDFIDVTSCDDVPAGRSQSPRRNLLTRLCCLSWQPRQISSTPPTSSWSGLKRKILASPTSTDPPSPSSLHAPPPLPEAPGSPPASEKRCRGGGWGEGVVSLLLFTLLREHLVAWACRALHHTWHGVVSPASFLPNFSISLLCFPMALVLVALGNQGTRGGVGEMVLNGWVSEGYSFQFSSPRCHYHRRCLHPAHPQPPR